MSSFAGENEGDERSAFYAAAWRARGFGPSRWVGGRPTCPAPAPGQRIENELARAQLDRRSVPSEFRPRPLPSGLNPPKSARIRGYQPSLDGGVSGLLEPVLRLFRFLRDVSPEREVASSNLAGRTGNCSRVSASQPVVASGREARRRRALEYRLAMRRSRTPLCRPGSRRSGG